MTKEKTAKLTIRLEGRQITHERFVKAVESFFGLLTELTAEMAGNPRAVQWIVSVKEGSINLGATASAPSTVPTSKIVSAAFTGMKELQTTGKRPPHFTDEALQDARKLATLVDGSSVQKIQLFQSRKQTRVSAATVANVDAILGGRLTEVGTIEGRLEMISTRGSLHVGVWDALEDRLVQCFVKPEMLDDIKRAFDKRVAVSGLIRLRATGEPASIEVETLEVFPSEEDLPNPEKVYGIFSTR